MNIGKRIKYVRMLRGMRQEELAGKVGLGYNENGRTRISQYENGKRTPKAVSYTHLDSTSGFKFPFKCECKDLHLNFFKSAYS